MNQFFLFFFFFFLFLAYVPSTYLKKNSGSLFSTKSQYTFTRHFVKTLTVCTSSLQSWRLWLVLTILTIGRLKMSNWVQSRDNREEVFCVAYSPKACHLRKSPNQSWDRSNPVVDSLLKMLISEQWLMWMISVFLNVTILTTILVYVEMIVGRNINRT